jgi:hypothetical protein
MALSPFLGAIAFQTGGANLTFGLLAFLGSANLLVVGLLCIFCRGGPTAAEIH